MSYTAINDSRLDAGSGITEDVLFDLRDNPLKIISGEPDAPRIQTGAYESGSVTQSVIAANAVGQSEIKTATAVQSIFISSGGTAVSLALIGASYSMITGLGATNGSASLGLRDGTDVNGYVYFEKTGSTSVTGNVYSRYFQASPPYNLGDGDIPLFLYVILDSNGKPESVSVSHDPIWAYHGPTNIQVKRLCKVSGRQFCEAMLLPSGLSLLESKEKNPEEFLKYMNGDVEAELTEIELTQSIKNKDKDLIPHPYTLNDNNGKTAVLLNPVSPLTERMSVLHDSGENVIKMIEKGYFIIDNENNGCCSAKGLMPVNFRFKNNKRS